MSFLVKTKPKTVAEFLGRIGAVEAPEVPDNIGMLAGGAIGAIAFPEHRVLGVIGGASLGRNLPMLLSEHRGAGVRHMAVTGSAIVGALIGSAHRKTKVGKAVGAVVGFSAGWLIAGAIDAYRSKR